MYKLFVSILFALCFCCLYAEENEQQQQQKQGQSSNIEIVLPLDLTEQKPTILIALLVRNKAHVLPLFLTYLERLNYPKERISLWIRSDYNHDNSIEILKLWLNNTAALYHSVNHEFDELTQQHANESSAYDWPHSRFRHLITLKEEALVYAQQIWADFIFYLDADALLVSPETLAHLTNIRVPIIAPMLQSDGLYSNFWCGMTPQYYYQRTDEYMPIYEKSKIGTYTVAMVHSAVLIHLNAISSRFLTFNREQLIAQQQNNAILTDKDSVHCRLYDGPLDDIIIFAISANCSNTPLFINNEIQHGYIVPPLESSDDLEQDLKQLQNIRMNIIHDYDEVAELNDYFKKYQKYSEKHKLTLDHIYMINLERRPERRYKMENAFHELGLDVEYFAAIDGKELTDDILKSKGIKFLSGYEDPYHNRQMTMGEIGCFLSHYYIWEKIVEKQQNEVLILEDDIRFEPYFNEKAIKILEEARKVIDYDLIYFGRKRLKEEKEAWVADTDNLVHAGYSYWTLGYVISLEGARKLLAAKPLEKLLPVDEYLPIMFDRHPNKTWSDAFEGRNLYAFSASPLILFPTHYTGEDGYISDTEDSELTNENLNNDTKHPQLKSDRELNFDEKQTTTNKNDKILIQNNINLERTHTEL